RLAQAQLLVQLQGDEDAPRFAQGNEPTQDGRAYRAQDGRTYYRPLLRVAHRTVDPQGPDVRFLKDAEGAVWLYFELEEHPPAGMARGAVPFEVRVEQVALQWQGTSGSSLRVFDEPTLVAAQGEESEGAPH